LQEKRVEETVNTKFFGLQIDNHIIWKNYIDTIPELSGACYAVMLMLHISNFNTVNLVCLLSFSYKIWNEFLG